jgi:hypothetical protein
MFTDMCFCLRPDCEKCLRPASPTSPRPVYCDTPPCQWNNGHTGAAICTGPFALPIPTSATANPIRYASFVGLDHALAWAPSMRGPWTVGTAGQVGQHMAAAISTSSAMYVENPVTTRMHYPYPYPYGSSADGSGEEGGDDSKAYVTVFDTVSPSGGWVESAVSDGGSNISSAGADGGSSEWMTTTSEGGQWVSGPGADRGEHYGFGLSFSLGGRYWSKGVDVPLPGGCRTPLGLIEEDGGYYTLLFTRRFVDCSKQEGGLPPGSRGDAANDPTMCANLYSARFRIASWRPWTPGA